MKRQFAAPSPNQVRSAELFAGGLGISRARPTTWHPDGGRTDECHGAERGLAYVVQLAMLVSMLLLLQALFGASAKAAPSLFSAGAGQAKAATTEAVSLAGVRSRKTHGSIGTFDLVLSSTLSNPSTEPRYGGPTGSYLLVFVFSKVVTSGTAIVTEGVATAGTPYFNGNEMLVPLTGVGNARYVTVAVNDVNGNASGLARLGFLTGDVNGSRSVTLSDVLMVNAGLSQAVTASNFLLDVNASGTLSLGDKIMVDAFATYSLPSPGLAGPAVSISNPGSGSTYTISQTVTINASASDANGVTKVEFYDGATLKGTATSAPYSQAWAVGSADNGTHSWTAVAYNSSSSTVSSPVLLTVNIGAVDATPPTGAIAINSGAPYTATPGVTLSLTATDATGVIAYYIGTSSATPSATAAGWTTISPTTSYGGNVAHSLATGDGTKALFAWYKDAAGNVSSAASDSILLDQTAPVGGSLAASPSSGQIVLSWSGFSDSGSGLAGSSYKLVFGTAGSPASCSGAALYTGAATSYTHTGLTNGTPYYYRVCVSDNAGNVANGAVATATPNSIVDTTAPIGSMVINGGAAYTMSGTVTLSLSATDGVGVTGYWLSIGSSPVPTGSAIGWNPVTSTTTLSTNITYTFPFTADGNKTVYAWYKDAAGNVSAMATASVVLDKTMPTNGSLTATPALGLVNLAWTGFSDFGSGLATSNAYTLVYSTTGSPANCAGGASLTTLYTGTATSFTHSNPSPGTLYYYRVCATDNVGNISTGATASATPQSNQPPVAKAGPDQMAGPGVLVYFDAAGSNDPDGSIATYRFEFGDGLSITSANGGVVSHAYSAAGIYTMTLTVTDNLGATSTDTARVTITAPPTAQGNYRFARGFAGASSDSGNAVAVDAAGNVVVVGTFQGTTDVGGATPLVSTAGTTDIFIAKYTPAGQLVCARQIGGVADDRAYAIKTDAAGSMFIAGSFQGTVDFGGVSLSSAAASTDIFVAKYAANCSAAQWVRNLGSSTDDVGYGVAVDLNGDVVVTGYFSGSANFGAGAVLSNGPFGDAFVVKYSGSNGSYQWARTLYGPSIDIGRSVAVDKAGNVIVAGSFQTTVSDGQTFAVLMTSAGSVDSFLLKFSPSGDYLWTRSFGGSGDDVAYGVDVDSGGNIAVVGSFQNTMFLGGFSLTSAGLSDTFVAKFSPMGNHLWSKAVGGTGIDVDYAVAVDAWGNVVMTGGYQFVSGQWDILVAKYSAAGTPLWSKSFGGGTNDVGFGVASDPNGNVFVTGYFQGTVNFGGTSLTSAGLTDGFLLSLTP